LHEHIQTAMGWTNFPPPPFQDRRQRYGDAMLLEENFAEMDYEDSTSTRLSEILPKTDKRFRLEYEYDFGDGFDKAHLNHLTDLTCRRILPKHAACLAVFHTLLKEARVPADPLKP
jgi:hypothetical protein